MPGLQERNIVKAFFQNREIASTLIGLIIVFTILSPIHERGHYVVAKWDGAYIYQPIHWFWIDQYGLHNPQIIVNEFTFSSLGALILFRVAGLLVSAIPLGVLSFIIHRKRPAWLNTIYLPLLASLIISFDDLLNIGRNLENAFLGLVLSLSVSLVPTIFLVRLISRFYKLLNIERAKLLNKP